jgi:hypothetical protein
MKEPMKAPELDPATAAALDKAFAKSGWSPILPGKHRSAPPSDQVDAEVRARTEKKRKARANAARAIRARRLARA